MITNDSGFKGNSRTVVGFRDWGRIPRAFRIATRIRVLLLAFMAMIATTAGWRLCARILPPATSVEKSILGSDVRSLGAWPWTRFEPSGPLARTAMMKRVVTHMGNPPEDPLRALPRRWCLPIKRLISGGMGGWVGTYYLLGLLWSLLCWSFFGTAIARSAALEFTRDDRLGLGGAIQFAQRKFTAHLGSLGLPLMGVVFGVFPLAMVGLLMRWGGNFGAAVGGVLWMLGMLVATVSAVLLLLLACGWPLLWGALATEASDTFDAVSRVFAYTAQRPLKYLGMGLAAIGIGLLGWFGVFAISETMIQLGRWAAGLTAGAARMAEITAVADGQTTDSSLLWFAGHCVGLTDNFIRGLAQGFSYSFVVCVAVAIYLLLRGEVDHVELGEIELQRDKAPELQLAAVGREDRDSGDRERATTDPLRDDQAHP